jgi:hypothetical protein
MLIYKNSYSVIEMNIEVILWINMPSRDNTFPLSFRSFRLPGKCKWSRGDIISSVIRSRLFRPQNTVQEEEKAVRSGKENSLKALADKTDVLLYWKNHCAFGETEFKPKNFKHYTICHPYAINQKCHPYGIGILKFEQSTKISCLRHWIALTQKI